jgi:large subunit ribosomal protein L34e
MVQRLTYRRRHAYNTTSNRIRKVKTPGGVLSLQYLTKKTNIAKCGDCGHELQGIPSIRPKALRTLKQRERHITRAYGGSRCASCVRSRIVRAFLIEEQKIVKAVMKQRGAAKKE